MSYEEAQNVNIENGTYCWTQYLNKKFIRLFIFVYWSQVNIVILYIETVTRAKHLSSPVADPDVPIINHGSMCGQQIAQLPGFPTYQLKSSSSLRQTKKENFSISS